MPHADAVRSLPATMPQSGDPDPADVSIRNSFYWSCFSACRKKRSDTYIGLILPHRRGQNLAHS